MNYARNAWYVAAWADELADDSPMAITILGDPVVVYRASVSGKLVALQDRCVHRMAPLSLGRCEGDRLRCMYHGLLFDPDGSVAEIPGQDMIPPQAKVRSYPVAVRGNWIWIWMGDAALADEALVPPAIGRDHSDYIMGQGYLDYAAEARLINDNLLDFSHLSFVHANSFGVGPDFAESLPKVEPIDRGVRFTRWIVGAERPGALPGEGVFDNYMCNDFMVPGILLMWSGSFPPGTAEACKMGPPDRSKAVAGVNFTSQAVTPMADKTSRYFFCWGPHRDHGNAEVRDGMMAIAGMAFAEDKTMIEAQQRVIDAAANPSIMPTAHDKGVTLFNRMVERMVTAEAG